MTLFGVRLGRWVGVVLGGIGVPVAGAGVSVAWLRDARVSMETTFAMLVAASPETGPPEDALRPDSADGES